MTARVHGIPTPSLNPDTKDLAAAAERMLGPSTRARSPSSTATTPISPHFYGGGDQLADVLRQSPGIDLSSLNIKAGSVSAATNLILIACLYQIITSQIHL